MPRGFSTYPVDSVSLAVNRNVTPLTDMTGETKFSAGGFAVSGSCSALLRPTMYNLMKTYLLSNLTTYTISPIASIVLSTDSTSYTLTNLVFNGCELQGSAKDFIRVSFNFIAQKVDQTGSDSDTSYSETPAIFYNTVVTAAGTNLYSSFSLKVERAIDSEHYIIGKETLYLPNGQYIQAGPTIISGNLSSKRPNVFNQTIVRTSGTDIPSSTVYLLPTSSCKIQMSCGTINITKIYLTECSLSGQGRQKFDSSVSFTADLTGTTPITAS